MHPHLSPQISLLLTHNCIRNVYVLLTVHLSIIILAINQLNPLNAKLNPICHLVALLGAHPILHVSGVRVNAQNLVL